LDYDFCYGRLGVFGNLFNNTFAAAACRTSRQKIFLYGFSVDFNAVDDYHFWFNSGLGRADKINAGKIYGILGDAEKKIINN
jgi:hypothetical protein